MSKISAVVDRIEGNMAVLLLGDESHRITLPTTMLPSDAGEGTVIRISIETDQESTVEAKQKVQDLIDRLSGGNELH